MGWVNQKNNVHQAARVEKSRRVKSNKAHAELNRNTMETTLPHPYQTPNSFIRTAVIPCQIGKSSGVGAPLALKPGITGRIRSMRPRAYSTAVARCWTRIKPWPLAAMNNWSAARHIEKNTTRKIRSPLDGESWFWHGSLSQDEPGWLAGDGPSRFGGILFMENCSSGVIRWHSSTTTGHFSILNLGFGVSRPQPGAIELALARGRLIDWPDSRHGQKDFNYRLQWIDRLGSLRLFRWAGLFDSWSGQQPAGGFLRTPRRHALEPAALAGDASGFHPPRTGHPRPRRG